MLLFIIVFAVTLVFGMPVAFSLGLTGLAHLVALGDERFFIVFIQRMVAQLDMTSLTCLPFFILAGYIMNEGGVTTRLLNFLRQLVGWFRGGLAYCTVIIAAILAAILGSPNAVCSMLCGVLVPEMRKDGYPEEFTGSLVAASSVLGPVIPPSFQFIVFSMMTGVSIKGLFMGGVLPGVLLALAFCVIIGFMTRKKDLGKSVDKFSLRKTAVEFVKAVPALLVPIVMVGGIVGGIFTATESGAVACLLAIIAGVIYREFDFRHMPKLLVKCGITTGSILLIVAFGGTIAWTLSMSGVPQALIAAITGLTTNKNIIILLIMIILTIGGCFLEATAMTMVFTPIIWPLAQAIGMDGVHFGLIFSILIIIGFITPPVGTLLFVTSNIAQIELKKVCKEIWPFAIASLIIITALAYLPDLVLWLPRLCGYSG